MSLEDREELGDKEVPTLQGVGLFTGLTLKGDEVWIGIQQDDGVILSVECDPARARQVADTLIELAGEAESNV